MLPFVLTSPSVSGTPAYIPDPDAHVDPEPVIAIAAPVYDKARRRIGEVEGVDIDEASGRITRRTETAIPASLIASVGDEAMRGPGFRREAWDRGGRGGHRPAC